MRTISVSSIVVVEVIVVVGGFVVVVVLAVVFVVFSIEWNIIDKLSVGVVSSVVFVDLDDRCYRRRCYRFNNVEDDIGR